MDFIISNIELEKIIAKSTEIGFQRGLETVGAAPRFVSQNYAYKRFLKARVKNWVENNLIKPAPNGNGKTSTVYYEYAKLLELEASNTIIIRKAYNK